MNLGKIFGKITGFFNKIKETFSSLLAKMASFTQVLKSKVQPHKSVSPGAGLGSRGSRSSRSSHSGTAGFAEQFSNGLRRFEMFRASLNEKIDFISDSYLSRFPENIRRPIFFGFAGLTVLFLILMIAVLAGTLRNPDKKGLTERIAGPGIPHEELFFPAEPDFLPGFLLEREPRRFWTIEDIRPYWRSPGNSDFWQREVHTAMDKLMEGVP